MADRRNELALAIMASTLITGELKAKNERAELTAILADQDAATVPVRDAEGVELGKASLVGGKPQASVTDDRALLAWVKKNHPDMVREIVDNAYITKLLKFAETDGTVATDPSTGEIIPGIEVGYGNQYVKVTPNPVARERMTALIHESGLLQLTEAKRVVEHRPAAATVAFAGLDDEEASPW